MVLPLSVLLALQVVHAPSVMHLPVLLSRQARAVSLNGHLKDQKPVSTVQQAKVSYISIFLEF